MKPIASTITEIDHLPGEEVKFSISPANSAWVMRSMADLYSNRELAVIREYSTNAYDSNLAKARRDGHDVEPIEVTLPSAMHPYFTVADKGLGMSEAELKEVYTQFGESTKRDSDDFNGMLGFGSKSAVAYTNSFTVTAVKNGIKTVGSVTRREDAMGGYLVTMKIVLSGVQTVESDGVSVEVPVHNWREFEQKAYDFYRFWLPGRVLVNGKAPKWAVGDRIDNNLYYNATAGSSYVVMGNVPYKIANPDALFPPGMNRISFVAYVPLGAVEFTPAREALKYSDHTKRNLEKIIKDFSDKAIAMAKKEIAEAKTHYEAYNTWSKWKSVIGGGQVADLTFKGDKLVDRFQIEAMRYDAKAYRNGTWRIREWSISMVSDALIVTGFRIELTANHKRKVKDWMSHVGMTARYILFTADNKVSSPWVDASHVVEWEKVKAEAPKPPKKPRVIASGRKAGTFDLVTRNGYEYESDVPSTKELYYITVKDFNAQENRGDMRVILDELNIDHKVVKVPANRMDKFLRFYPHAKNIIEYLRSKVVLDGMSLLTPEAKVFLSTADSERKALYALDVNRIDDPEVAALAKIFQKREVEYLAEYNKNRRMAFALGLGNKFTEHKWTGYWDKKGRPLSEKYPLALAGVGLPAKDYGHLYIYMNEVYRLRKDGKNV